MSERIWKWTDRPEKPGRFELLKIAFGVWAMATAYAIAHDQYIVRLAPEHFTLYHRSIPGVESAHLQAAILAFLAAIVPGFMLGIGLAFTCAAGPEPRVPVTRALAGTAGVIAVSEAFSVVAGVAAWARGAPLYGHDTFFVPDMPLELIVTQTIQITCYGAATVSSAVLIAGFMAFRCRARIAAG